MLNAQTACTSNSYGKYVPIKAQHQKGENRPLCVTPFNIRLSKDEDEASSSCNGKAFSQVPNQSCGEGGHARWMREAINIVKGCDLEMLSAFCSEDNNNEDNDNKDNNSEDNSSEDNNNEDIEKKDNNKKTETTKTSTTKTPTMKTTTMKTTITKTDNDNEGIQNAPNAKWADTIVNL